MDKYICDMCGKEFESPVFDVRDLLGRLQQNGFTQVEALLIYDILGSYEFDLGLIDEKPDRYVPEIDYGRQKV